MVALLLGMKEPGLEADHSLLPIAQLKNTCSHTSTLPYTFMAYKVTTLQEEQTNEMHKLIFH